MEEKLYPSQGIKWDFSYKNSEHKSNELFMIWPQFLDEYGKVLPYTEEPVPTEGHAKMWIVDEKMKEYHRNKIYVGMRANGMEGTKVVANYVVTEIKELNF